MEIQMTLNNGANSPIEFPSQTTGSNDENHTHMEDKEEESKQWTRTEVSGTDPTRPSELISNKVLITKTMDDIPVTKIPKMYKDAMDSPEGK